MPGKHKHGSATWLQTQSPLHQEPSQKENYLPHAFLKCMGGKLWIIIIGFQLKLSLGLLLTALRSTSSSSHFFPCSASPPLLHRNFRYIFYVAIFSNISHFFPSLGSWLMLASSLLSVCSCSYQHSSLRLSLSLNSPSHWEVSPPFTRTQRGWFGVLPYSRLLK